MVIKVNEKAILDRIDVLKEEIANNDTKAEQKAKNVCDYLGTPEDVADIKAYFLERKAEFNVADKQKELDYLNKYCYEYEEPKEQTESETEEPQIYG